MAMFLALAAGAPAAEAPDYHITADPAQRLFRASPFAHGYIHGYEYGFALGDEDIQIGRGAQDVRRTEAFRDADGGYHKGFGNRESFRWGFRAGLAIGYRDALFGGEFRALGELRRLASGLHGGLLFDVGDTPYDGGFRAGYSAARQEATNDCESEVAATRERFCAGFFAGYELGEADTGAATTAAERGTPPALQTRRGARHYPRR